MPRPAIKDDTRFRVISSDVCFYATAEQIEKGVGDFMTFNTALRMALSQLLENEETVGLSGTWMNIPVQINVVT